MISFCYIHIHDDQVLVYGNHAVLQNCVMRERRKNIYGGWGKITIVYIACSHAGPSRDGSSKSAEYICMCYLSYFIILRRPVHIIEVSYFILLRCPIEVSGPYY